MKRSSGVLLPVFSLPGELGIGDLGISAYEFIDFLKQSGQSFWEVLPINPVDPLYDNSPYSPLSSFAGNTLFINVSLLKEHVFFENISKSSNLINYDDVKKMKYHYFMDVYRSFKKEDDYYKFIEENKDWIYDYALFISIRNYIGKRLYDWPYEIKTRNKDKLKYYQEKLKKEIDFQIFLQYIFYKQWYNLKKYANKKGIKIIGDLPIYVNYDSADVWSHPEYFMLDEKLNPLFVSGVPPDFFSKTGQLWGNPIFNWDKIKEENFRWWIDRFIHTKKLYDVIRLDHFRGYVAYWEVPFGEETAINGKWVKGPGEELFKELLKKINDPNIIAEDLGLITPDVIELRDRFNFPGMKVLQFAFDGNPSNDYKPHNYNNKNCIVFTGTHDNNTTIGWFQESGKKQKMDFIKYIGGNLSEKINWAFIRLAMSSICDVSIIPMQDVLGLGKESRINTPGTIGKNWKWKLSSNYYSKSISKRLLEYTETYGRI
ncbi:MAG: 4-alpha-glucanotransferase [Caldisphaera sp.]|uniref:4-alpha-glucanotransferase n=1 Tax=Caldisphaera sp. TaxID=2060322 RepID=UPI000CC598C0|nr:MAG: 4-alpha-glucanotransferase [Caldisphaera sp.]